MKRSTLVFILLLVAAAALSGRPFAIKPCAIR